MTADLIAGDGGPDGSFRVLPYKMDGLANGIPNDKAEVDVTELAIEQQPDPSVVQVRVVADLTWYFGPHWLTGTRTYTLVMVPGTEPDAMAWQVSGASVSESEWVVSE